MTLHHGDCLDVMATLPPESVAAIVTDPPYGLEFMGKEWDRLGPRQGNAALHPTARSTGPIKSEFKAGVGTRMGAPRKNPRCRRCERLKFDHPPRKCVCVAPDWDTRTAEYAREMQCWHESWAAAALRVAKPGAHLLAFGGTRTYHRLACAIEDAGWEIRDCLVWAYASGFPKSLNLPGGLGTALKPAWEPIVMARKPLRGTVAANVEHYGTGALNIDATRIPAAPYSYPQGAGGHAFKFADGVPNRPDPAESSPLGRWPANLLLTDPIFDGGVEGVVGGGEANRWFSAPRLGDGKSSDPNLFREHAGDGIGYGDSGTYSRFFLVPKADRGDREPVLTPNGHDRTQRFTTHPTVKPIELMRHLVRLVAPPGGTVLDPFLGSGTTALAAEMEGFPWIGIEREAEYVAIAEARLNGVQRGLGLPA